MDNHDEFIREITLRICSSLEIKESLRSAFEYLREQFPLEALVLFIIDERLGAIRRIEHASENVTLPSHLIPLPEGMLQKIAGRNFSEPFIVDIEKDEILGALAPMLNLEGNTDLIVPLRIKGELIGGLNLRASGEGRYGAELLELAGRLAEPFAIALANALAHEEVLRYQAILLDDKRFLNRELHGGGADGIIGGNTGLRNVMEMVRQVAPLNNTVLMLGETGTGKEVIANAIHFTSPRKDGPFIKVNCGAMPENLIDSELFGHERGAFTGAVTEKPRSIRARSKAGPSFWTRLANCRSRPRSVFCGCSRIVKSRRVGGSRPIPVDIRVIAATHRNLQSMVTEGSFREDLWYRFERFSHHYAAASAAEGRYAGPYPPLRDGQEQGPRNRGSPVNRAGGTAAAHGIRLARKCSGVGEPGRAGVDPAS